MHVLTGTRGTSQAVLDWFPYALILLLAPAYIYAAVAPGAGVFHDDGVYMVTARALASGAGYRIDSLPGDVAQTKYPFLYPAMLAVVWRLLPGFAARVAAFKLLSLAFTVLWMAAVHRLARRWGVGRQGAGWVCFMTLSSGLVTFVATSVLPDSLFSFLSTVVLILLVSCESGDSGAGRGAVSGVLAGAAFLTRTVGVALIGAGFLGLVLKRKYKLAAVFLVCAGVMCAPWLWWQHAHAAPSDRVLAYYTKASYQGNTIGTLAGAGEVGKVLTSNAIWLAGGLGFLLHLPTLFDAMLSTGVAVLIAIEMLRECRAGRLIAPFWACAYLLLLWAWVAPPFRYMIPLLPLAGIWIVRLIAGVQSARVRLAWAGAGATVLIACGAANAATTVFCVHEAQASSFLGEPMDDYREVQALCRWVRSATPPRSVVAANDDPLINLLSGRKAIRLWASDQYRTFYATSLPGAAGTPTQFQNHLLTNRVQYLLLTPMPGFLEAASFNRVLRTVVEQCPGSLQMAERLRDARYFIFEVKRARLAACVVRN